jgi:hypothetical protein
VLDTVADIFGGKEIDRAQSRQFITLLRGLAIDADAAVVIAAHPSLQGIATDTGLSGSTGWHNSVRARMYFKNAPGDDNTLRVLECRKNQYGPVSESILLRWRDGVFVVERKATLDLLAAEAEIDYLFLKLLRRFAEQGRNVTDKKGTSFAPALFAAEPEAKAIKATSKMLGEAMVRLFAGNKIRVLTEGPKSKQRTRIVEVEVEDASASTNVPPPFHQPSTNVPPLSPHTPLPGGNRAGLVETPAGSAGQAREQAGAAGAAEYLYTWDRGSEEDWGRGNHALRLWRHRITQRTAKYVYFDGQGESCDERGEVADGAQVRSLEEIKDSRDVHRVDRVQLERDGEASLRCHPYRVFISLERLLSD